MEGGRKKRGRTTDGRAGIRDAAAPAVCGRKAAGGGARRSAAAAAASCWQLHEMADNTNERTTIFWLRPAGRWWWTDGVDVSLLAVTPQDLK